MVVLQPSRGLNAHGIGVAIPSYDRHENVSVGDIIARMRTATRELGGSVAPSSSGHSAGGHLAACMLATDWRALDVALPEPLVTAAYTISGLFDLVPLVKTSINHALRLDATAAREASPLLWTAPKRGSLDAVVGGNESAEYFRQSRSIVEAWGAAGVATSFAAISGANHFTAVAPLVDPHSPMTLRLKALAR